MTDINIDMPTSDITNVNSPQRDDLISTPTSLLSTLAAAPEPRASRRS